MTQVLRDARYAVRTLLKRPAFSTTVVITLALGIGANAAIFSVVSGVLLRPLPYPEPHNLVAVWTKFLPESGVDYPIFSLSAPEYLDYRDQNRTMESVAAYSWFGATLTEGEGEPERLTAVRVTSNLFPLLRTPVFHGRALIPEDDNPNAAPTVVLSHTLWQRRFGGDEAIVGQTISVNGEASQVVGIMPPGFAFPSSGTQLWAAMQLDETQRDTRSGHWILAVARLAEGSTLEHAKAELEPMMAHWKVDYPDEHTGHFIWLRPFIDDLVGQVRPALLLLMGAVGLVLLIACANVANLLLAVGEHRRHEIAVRRALGASRGRILQQLLTESALLSVVGGAVGLALADLGTEALLALDAGNIPRAAEIALDIRVLTFTAGLTLATSVVFGLAPALQSTSPDIHDAFRGASRRTTVAIQRRRLRQLLVVSEMALSILLLIGAGLLVKSFWRLVHADPGFEATGILVAEVRLPEANYDPDQAVTFYSQLLEHIEAVPGVEMASAISSLPVRYGRPIYGFLIEGRPEPQLGDKMWDAAGVTARSGYFETMGIPVLRGRGFDGSDRAGSLPVVVINESMARTFWPGEDPIGQRLRYSFCEECGWMTIVGIVGDVMYQGVGVAPETRFIYYVSHEQAAQTAPFMTNSMGLAIKTQGDPLTVAPAVRTAVRNLDQNLPVIGVAAMTDVVAGSLARPRFTMTLLGIFAGVALILGAVGIYGVISHSVAERTNEIGVRMALGAGRRAVTSMVVGQGMRLALIGVAFGLLAALGVTRVMNSLLFNVDRTDPVTIVAVSALLSAIALLACYLPARRAARVDPMTAMRSE
ncbi:MAG: FtsX-like permease family protein [Gemmatimonadales bacterium]|nr:FtsX-like permease family protein [Gemmatimonadales bacterium]NIN10668.1 FtsX-like permease family protein [Gemmatimonadales bacterium]NIN48995.1 FtsX-like permease family protein [Gemmatimonadales bacterium]NIP06459.1 FtsX-like permease family protein [Gemmatimonadales bacterium]NIQ98805.1 FtsX-like permease family protein [Gemmatimonadales bacterium]